MDKKSKIFFTVFFASAFIAAFISFYRFYILRDYYIELEVGCNPSRESCFVYECDPEEDSECPGNIAERTSYYKLINKKAVLLPDCDPSDPACPPITCGRGEDCEEILCSADTKSEDEECSGPIIFNNKIKP